MVHLRTVYHFFFGVFAVLAWAASCSGFKIAPGERKIKFFAANDMNLSIVHPLAGDIINRSNAKNLEFSGVCSDNGEAIAWSFDPEFKTVCSKGSWQMQLDLSVAFSDGNIELSFYHFRSDGGSANAKVELMKDTIAPVITVVASPALMNRFSTKILTVQGRCDEVGRKVKVEISGSEIRKIDTNCDQRGAFGVESDLSSYADGKISVVASQMDDAGNVGSQSKSIVKYSGEPSLAVLKPANMETILLSNMNAVELSGSCSENGQSVIVKQNTLEERIVCASGQFQGILNLSHIAETGDYNIEFSHGDAYENVVTVSRSIQVVVAANESFAVVSRAEKHPVDILFVVDNSRSMDLEQEILSASFAGFMAGFLARQVDFHIGVALTDNSVSYGITLPFGFVSAGAGGLISKGTNRPILAYDDLSMNLLTPEELIGQFTETIPLVENDLPKLEGCAEEAGLLGAINSLSADKVKLSSATEMGGRNEGFYREGADTVLIIVSDEDEYNYSSNCGANTDTMAVRVAKYKNRLEIVKNDLLAIKKTRVVFVTSEQNACNTKDRTKGQFCNTNYKAAKAAFDSYEAMQTKIVDIAADFSQELINIGKDIANIIDSKVFGLNRDAEGLNMGHQILLSSIKVYATKNANETLLVAGQYTFNGDTKELTIVDPQNTLEAGPNRLRVEYLYK